MTTILIIAAVLAAVLLFAWAWAICRAAADRLDVDEGQAFGGDDE